MRTSPLVHSVLRAPTSSRHSVLRAPLSSRHRARALQVCTQALERLADPMGRDRAQNVKALFRRAKARIGRSEFKQARADVKAALAADPTSREVRTRARAASSPRAHSHERIGRILPTSEKSTKSRVFKRVQKREISS